MKDENDNAPVEKKPSEAFRGIKVAGVATAIPMMLVAGPIVGCLVGFGVAELLHKWLGAKPWYSSAIADLAVVLFALLGLLAGILQSIKLIRLAGRYQNED